MLEYLNPIQALAVIRGYLATGGPVVSAIMVTAFFMWALIIERMVYFGFGQRGLARRASELWAARADHSSWAAHRIRERLISEQRLSAEQFFGLIRVLILVTPLLGLLGTVTGMIMVFDSISGTGSSNARVMASGISKATIPTMTGLAVALSGVFLINLLDRRAARSVAHFADTLEIQAEPGTPHGGHRRLTGNASDTGEVNITPLLDIVFILLIFFIVTATFVREVGLGLNTPQDDPPQEETVPPPTMVLSVRNDGFVMVNDVRMIDPRSVKPVVEEFKAREPRGVVLVSVAPEAEAQATVTVVDQSRLAGVEPAVTLQQER